MKKVIFSLLLIVFAYAMCGCAPVTLQKCYTDYEYTAEGKIKQEYKECITQVPGQIPAVNPKHKDLYE